MFSVMRVPFGALLWTIDGRRTLKRGAEIVSGCRRSFDRINEINMILKAVGPLPPSNPVNHLNPVKIAFRCRLVLARERGTIGLAMANYAWIWGSWTLVLHSPWADMVLALAAVLCGVLIGGERQRREKPAGLRTLSLVCLGAAVFTMASFAFTTTTGDSGRVAAQIVTGIGFLGAGVILHGRRIVSGVTTAAIIWVAASVGMVVGAGYVVAGVGLSILVNRLMTLFFLYETQWHPDLHEVRVVLEYAPQRGITRVRMERILADYQLSDDEKIWSEPSADLGRLTLSMKMARVHLYELLAELVDVPGVASSVREQCVPVNKPAPSS
jgi:putative Mg2+ transporter-C (MgtC) family protein